jgi:hypothetical protein
MFAATLETFLAKASDQTSLGHVDSSRRLIAKCLNKIAGQMELTSPQVSAYLLGITDHYTPSKFASIYIETFESYLTKEWAQYQTENSMATGTLENDTQSSTETRYDSEEEEVGGQGAESFLMSHSGTRMVATNIRVDYQFRGEELRGICLYDYISTINKIPINAYQLSALAEQEKREGNGNARVDRFFFKGGQTKCDDICGHQGMHPQHQIHC